MPDSTEDKIVLTPDSADTASTAPDASADRSNRAVNLQAPKGMRDFYPEEMAWRRHLEKTWREVSIRHGFDEVEGPTFEMLELYTMKSGEGIVSELFAFKDRGDRDLALRPEFTPTLARMVKSRAASLPRPIKWFAIPLHYRAERPQRGRLREFIQWNVDFLGDDSPQADVEVLAVAIDLLAELGLTREIVRVRLSHREAVSNVLRSLGLNDEQLQPAFNLLDRKDKVTPDEFNTQAREIGLSDDAVARFGEIAQINIGADAPWEQIVSRLGIPEEDATQLRGVYDAIRQAGLEGWCEFDLGIVRGLAYYTGMVFEIHEATGKERAIAGGGRYDRLIESFGGPSIPACGFGMGDVVLSLVLQDHQLLPGYEDLRPTPDVFLLSTGDSRAEAMLPRMLLDLRRAGVHARRSYRSTRNVGKLLKEASASGARYALILGKELEEDHVVMKDLKAGEQSMLSVPKVAEEVLRRFGRFSARGLAGPRAFDL
ncbi:MAG: histidine--tRNA ligase [Planctomycetota bacterium]